MCEYKTGRGESINHWSRLSRSPNETSRTRRQKAKEDLVFSSNNNVIQEHVQIYFQAEENLETVGVRLLHFWFRNLPFRQERIDGYDIVYLEQIGLVAKLYCWL